MGEATGKRSAELVGREPLLALIREQLVQIRSHGLRVVLLSGEPGIGKSRVLEAMAEEAVRQGLSVLAGGASDAVGMPPYLPFLEALGSYVRNAPLDLLREQVGGAASILA
ncbi:MAG TPA: ATP-binding protein, partial [Chloroflexia bacterium]|nr:ATP-binding protein [Chloroflexia bacterium]